MAKTRYPVTMPAPHDFSAWAVSLTKTRALCVVAALFGVWMMLAPAAHATELFATVTNPGFTDTFDIESNGGVADTTYGASYIDFAITNDSSGYGLNTATFGDALTAGYLTPYPEPFGFFGLGTTSGPGLAGTFFTDLLTPAAYDGSSPSSFNLQPGVYVGYSGTVLTLTAVPEPAAWALMLIGIGGLGAALRLSRSRRAMAAA